MRLLRKQLKQCIREQGSGSALNSPLCASFARRSGLDQCSNQTCCPVSWIGPLKRDVKRWRFREHPILNLHDCARTAGLILVAALDRCPAKGLCESQ